MKIPKTDLEKALLFSDLFKHKIKYNHTDGLWYIWNGIKWEKDKTEKIHQIVIEFIKLLYKEASNTTDDSIRTELSKIARDYENLFSQKKLLSFVKTLPIISKENKDFNAYDLYINCNDCTITILNGNIKLKKQNPDDFLTQQTYINYLENANCENWIKFIKIIFNNDNELINYIQKAVGYSFTGLTDEDCLFFCYGTGKNGKSTFFEILRLLFGDYYKKSNIDILMKKQNQAGTAREDIVRLEKARIVFTTEIEQGTFFAEHILKDLTGGDTITARNLYKSSFEFIPKFKLWIVGNHKPNLKTVDDGIRRRIKLIPFIVKIPNNIQMKRSDILSIMKNELSGILKWTIEGLIKYLQEGLKEPTIIKEATQEYFNEIDIINKFINENCIIDKKEFVLLKEFKDAFYQFCVEYPEYMITNRSLESKIKEQGYEIKAGRNNQRFIFGIKLKLMN